MSPTLLDITEICRTVKIRKVKNTHIIIIQREALSTKYFMPASDDLKLSLSIDASIYNDNDQVLSQDKKY